MIRIQLGLSARDAVGLVRGTLLLAGLCLGLVSPLVTNAQHDTLPTSTPPPPAGDGRLTIAVTHPSDPAAAEGLEIALYALAPDGRPGFVQGKTGPDGRFVFEGISHDPGIVYLAGVRHAEIPFGERVTFEPGEKEATVSILISDPTNQVSGVVVEELRARVDWLGDRLLVREILRLRNSGEQVIRVEPGSGADPIVRRRLGARAADFAKGASSIGEDLSLVDGEVRFWGPLYRGDQRVEYEYSLPLSASADDADEASASGPEDEAAAVRAALPVSMEQRIGRVVVVAGTVGIEASGPGLIDSSAVESDSGQSLAAWARSDIPANEALVVDLRLPETRRDASLLSIPRTDLWVELDDTQLSATVDMSLEVPPGPPVSGSPDAPLLRISLPKNARLGGVDPKAEALGLVPTADGGFDLVGPVPPGKTSLGYSFRMPTTPEGVDLDLQFPDDVATLNILIADTGLALESSRLHRRRPFRSGTRNFLHREAFNITPDEVVDLKLEPLSGAGLPQSAATALTLAAAVAGALFLIAPLRGAARRIDPTIEQSPLHAEREALYSTIQDLDHDFDTGKLEQEDYDRMRSELRAKAIGLLREEQLGAEAAAKVAAQAPARPTRDAPSPSHSPSPSPSSSRSATPSVAGAAAVSPRGAFCPHCGGAVRAEWRFCSHCGAGLEDSASSDHGGASG